MRTHENSQAGKEKISMHKGCIDITDDDAGQPRYAHWQDTVKHKMLARYYASIYQLADVEFQQIVAGMWRLFHVCNPVAKTSAGNNICLMQDIDKGLI